jgi:hypothetical protein
LFESRDNTFVSFQSVGFEVQHLFAIITGTHTWPD